MGISRSSAATAGTAGTCCPFDTMGPPRGQYATSRAYMSQADRPRLMFKHRGCSMGDAHTNGDFASTTGIHIPYGLACGCWRGGRRGPEICEQFSHAELRADDQHVRRMLDSRTVALTVPFDVVLVHQLSLTSPLMPSTLVLQIRQSTRMPRPRRADRCTRLPGAVSLTLLRRLHALSC